MAKRQITRRTFVSGSAAIGGAAMLAGKLPLAAAADGPIPRLPTDFGPCPRTLDEFLKYIVQRRAAEGLNRIVEVPGGSPAVGTAFGGSPQDMYLAFTAAYAYRYPWSRFHRDETLRRRAFWLIDTTTHIRADGQWDDGGLDAYFGFHGLALSVLSWKESGDVDAARLQTWTDAVVKAADDGLLHLHYGPYRYSPLTAQYANPEMYFLAGLAAAWKLTGDDRYRVEAAHGLSRYNEWLFKGGGIAYFLESSPQHGYQHMAVKAVALYWDLTRDPDALDFMKRMAPYFPNVLHRSGVLTDAEHPQIKHIFGMIVNPAVPAMVACVTGDGANRYAADAVLPVQADSVDDLTPSYGKVSITWYNYQAATYAAAALRLMERHLLPAAAPPDARRTFLDESFRGVRSHWDDFAAATSTRQISDSVAGAYIADTRERLFPLDSAMDGVYFEVLHDREASGAVGSQPQTIEYVCTEWSPILSYATGEGLVSRSCITRLCARYWSEMPRLPGDQTGDGHDSDWTSIQHWAVWQDYLVGFGALRSHATGGNASDVARVRWRLSPESRKLDVIEQTEKTLRFQYGRLLGDLACLNQTGGGSFKPAEITEAPRCKWTPLLVRPGAWSVGDYMNVLTVVRPANAAGSVATKTLTNGAAALLLEAGGRKGHVWVVNLTRNTEHFLMDVPAGLTVRTYKRDVPLPPVPPGQPAHAGLIGGESAVFAIESSQPIKPDALMAGIRQSNTSPLPDRHA